MLLTLKFSLLLLTVFSNQQCYVTSLHLREYLDGDSQLILDVHNSLRSQVGILWQNGDYDISNMNKLVWDYELQKEAKNQAVCENIGKDQDTSPPADYEYFYGASEFNSVEPGMNRAFSNRYTIRELIEGWFNQREYYSYEWQSCLQGKRCDEFLQLAWAKATHIGCYVNSGCVHDGAIVRFLVCLYNQPSTQFEQPFLIGEECSQCDNFCENGLCVSDCLASKGRSCECKKSCNHPIVGEGILNKATCTCDCSYGTGIDCEEPCENPKHYEDWDICADMDTAESCIDMPDWQAEWCPANCEYGCRQSPGSGESLPSNDNSGLIPYHRTI
ncbi:cysteine-rich venom protein VAR8-like [Glandiceps talaboti]